MIKLQGGIHAIDFEEGKEDIVYTAGADHTGQVYDRAAGRILSSLRGHSKRVTGTIISENFKSL